MDAVHQAVTTGRCEQVRTFDDFDVAVAGSDPLGSHLADQIPHAVQPRVVRPGFVRSIDGGDHQYRGFRMRASVTSKKGAYT